MPAAADDIGAVLRTARTAMGFTLEEAGQLTGYSAATMSRWETGHRRHWTVEDLRRLAEVYGMPPHLLGLAASSPSDAEGEARVLEGPQIGGDDQMRRRDLLAGTLGLTTGVVLIPTDAAEAKPTVADVIFGRLAAEPLADHQLAAQIAAAQADLHACRYTQLARRLPRLLAQAAAGHDNASINGAEHASGRLAEAYCLATQLMIKLHDDGMASVTADRAVQAARLSGDPVAVAETTRLAATVLRRIRHRDEAQRLVLNAAQQLDSDTGLTESGQATVYGQLLATAAYTAAMRDDRPTALTLLAEADSAVRRVSAAELTRASPYDLSVYKIGVTRILGDFGAAVDHARSVNPASLKSPARRARYWQDTALALHGRGKPTAAFRALLAAESAAPQEVRYRPWAQILTHDLLTTDTRGTSPGLRDFAHRIGVA